VHTYFLPALELGILHQVKLECSCFQVVDFLGAKFHFIFQGASMFHPPSRSWLNPQGTSGFIVKKTMRMDIPVEKYPNVRSFFHILAPLLFTADEFCMSVALCFTVQLCGATTWSKGKFP